MQVGGIFIRGYKTVKHAAKSEFTEKKSVFISHIAPVADENEAKSFISQIKSKHPDATHNVWAYILQGTEIARFSDDGEPSGTAGMPALEVLKREELSGVCVVITRYFGGTLLGAGGLVRAYAKGAKDAVLKAEVCEYVLFTVFNLNVSYSDSEKILRDLDKYKVRKSNIEYTDSVTLELSCRKESLDTFLDYANDLTKGKATHNIVGERFEGI